MGAEGNEHTDGGRRFVVLCAPATHGPGGAASGHVPDDLRRAIATRGADLLVRSCAYEAMADLVEHERALRSGGPASPLVLIVVEPDGVPGAGALVDAATRYTPHAVCWRYGASDEPRLAAFIDPAHAGRTDDPTETGPTPGPARPTPTSIPGAADTIRPHPTPSGQPRLRLTGEGSDVSHNEGEREPTEDPERPVLSEEELEMLLSDEWDRQTGGGGSA